MSLPQQGFLAIFLGKSLKFEQMEPTVGHPLDLVPETL
jgi:hypothetical protein